MPGIGATSLIGEGAGLALDLGEYAWNNYQANKDAANRPVYNIPPEVQEGLNVAKQQAMQGLPEAMKQQYISNLQRGQAYSLAQNQTRKGGLSNIAALNENQNQGYANLLSQDAQSQQAKMPALYGQLNNVAENKQQQWQINQENPYYENMARNQANRGALMQNINKTSQLALYGNGGGNTNSGMV